MPEEVIRCLDAIIRGDTEGWGIDEWVGYAREILASAVKDSKARVVAEDLIHYLGSRGYFTFRELL